PRYPISLEKAIPAVQRVLQEYRVAEIRLHQSLDPSTRKSRLKLNRHLNSAPLQMTRAPGFRPPQKYNARPRLKKSCLAHASRRTLLSADPIKSAFIWSK